MRTIGACATLLGMWLVGAGSQTDVRVRPQAVGIPPTFPSVAPASRDLTDVVQEYCVRCHNARRMTGNLTLEDFDVTAAFTSAETAEKMIVKLRAGMMPPPGARRPAEDTLQTLAATLETVIDERARARPDPGVRRFQRLNRAEYERVVGQLLDLEVDAGRWLPPDTYLGNFDNMSAAQGLSTTLLEAYLRAATEISRLAVGNPDAVPASTKYTIPIEVSQHAWDHVEGTPYGTRGGAVLTHDFPVDGSYVFSFETIFGNGTGYEDLDVTVDGRPLALLALEHGRGGAAPIRTEPIHVAAGQHRVAAAFVRRIEGPYEDRLSPHRWSFVGGEDDTNWADYGITALPHLTDVMITGPLASDGVSPTPSRRKVFTCRPAAPSEERGCAESILRRLATEAYRRPVTSEDVDGLLGFYDEGSADGGFEVGVRTALQAILASPYFVFRLERAAAGPEGEGVYRLTDLDLASRLSFFLWGMAPDDELRRVAQEGRLADDVVLEAQVRRLLADPRSEALATRFAAQWLRLQDAVKNHPEPYLYPDFTGQLRDDMVRETELFFDGLVREDGSFFDLLTADYTYANQRLAEHYGIEGVTGEEFRRVRYPDARRRGILGHGSVLLLTSMSDRTSPVLRGKWVMEVLMGAPPPPPPPNVPAFDETEAATGTRRLTTRERMEMHRANPTCNACHRLMDPIGLALDNFDVTGRWRSREHGMRLDTRGTFYDGTPVETPMDLGAVLLKRPTPLLRSFTSNLLAYAIGRRVEHFDQPAIRAVVRDAEADGYRMSSFILGVVRSDAFRMARSTPVAETGDGG
jgi:hypothetical protein